MDTNNNIIKHPDFENLFEFGYLQKSFLYYLMVTPNAISLRKLVFHFLSNSNSPRSYPIQFERKWNTNFLSVECNVIVLIIILLIMNHTGFDAEFCIKINNIYSRV